jgi:hypothetical protein
VSTAGISAVNSTVLRAPNAEPPNDEGHLSAAFEVSVGRFAGLFGSYALVGFDEVFTFVRLQGFCAGFVDVTTA